MPNSPIPPTSGQRRLVNVGLFIRFHLVALGRLLAFYELHRPQAPDWEGGGVMEVAFYAGIPVSFGIGNVDIDRD